MVEVRDLFKTYGRGERRVEAVRGVSFSARPGEVFALLGPNGAGKTTTIKSILGLVIPDSGRISVDGIDVLANRKEALRRISAVLEGNRNVHWRFTVEENLFYFGSIKGMSRSDIERRAGKVLEMLGLNGKRKQLAGKLSRGYQQRLAVAIAILPDTPIVLLDEPTLGLDVESSREIRGVLRSLAEGGKTVILSTHDMKLVESIADEVVIINHGKVVASGKTEELKDMFRRRAYRIVLESRPSERLLERLPGLMGVSEDGGKTVLNVEFPSSTAIYDLFDILKEERISIESVNSEDIDFEDVFLKIIGGDGR